MPSNLEYVHNVLINRILSDCPELNRRRNLTIKQFKPLTDLKENKTIMIKKAGKGSCSHTYRMLMITSKKVSDSWEMRNSIKS